MAKKSIPVIVLTVVLFLISMAYGVSEMFKDYIYQPGNLKPIDSKPKLKVGDKAPDFYSSFHFRRKSLSQPVPREKERGHLIRPCCLDSSMFRSMAWL